MAKLAALVNPVGVTPAFLVPLFEDPPVSNALLVQQISQQDVVLAFETIDIHTDALMHAARLPRIDLATGEQAIWGFAFDTDDIAVGTGSQIKPRLRTALRAGAFRERRLLEAEIASFCAEARLHRQALASAFATLRNQSVLGAEIWRDSTVLLPSLRTEIARWLRKTGVDVASIDWHGIGIGCLDKTLVVSIANGLRDMLGSLTTDSLPATKRLARSFGISQLEIGDRRRRSVSMPGTMDRWLTSIGLASRVAAFRARGINARGLHELSNDDLHELGLTPSERRRFRARLPGFPQERGSETFSAERRPLTVMFVDLVGSLALAEQIDPEQLLQVFNGYGKFCVDAINRYGGHVDRLLGDGVVAYFGYPQANENDPEHAVRAALDIVDGIGELITPGGDPLRARIGIATGRVIVGDLSTDGDGKPLYVTGSTVSLAARLQSLAMQSGIVIADETRRHVEGAFICEGLGSRELKGFDKLQYAWRVVGPATFRGGSRPTRSVTPFFNRESELAVLKERWAAACRGEASTVLVTGEPGMGKSRLVDEFLRLLPAHDARVVLLTASSFHQAQALRPVIDLFRDIAGLQQNDPVDAQVDRLALALGIAADARDDTLPLLSRMLGSAAQDVAVDEPQAELQQRLLDVLAERFISLAETKTLCLVIEDLHWLDRVSGELVDRLIDAIGGRRVMLLLTQRTADSPSRMFQSATVLRLKPLTKVDATSMVGSLLGEKSMSPRRVELIAARADGVPLFVEELTRNVMVEADESVDDGALAIPVSLAGALMARLDRAGPAREIAQIAAVAGRSVRREILAKVSGLSEPELSRSIAVLSEARLILPDDAGDNLTFSHALVRDIAYDTLLRAKRRELHLRVLQAMLTLNPDLGRQEPELVAMHAAEAGVEPDTIGAPSPPR